MKLNENIQQAKKILKDINKDTSNKDFLKIKRLTYSTPGYLGFFTKHYFKKGASLDNIEYVLNLLKNNKELLKKLDKQVVEYEDLEKLDDDLSSLIDFKTYNKELVSRMNSKFKKVARNDEELKTFWINLSDSDKKEVLLLMGTISFYSDYEDFKKVLVNGISNDVEEVIKKINSTNNAYLIHNSNGIIIAEIYNKEASVKLGSKAWCISREVNNAWDDYNAIYKKTKQYFVWNFRVPAYDIDSMMGATINFNGSSSYTHLKNDNSVSFNNYITKYEIDKKHFKSLDIKKDVDKIIKANNKNFELGKFLKNNQILQKYKSSFPVIVLIRLGVLTKEEIKNSEYGNQITKFKIEMLTEADSQYIKDIFGFVENIRIDNYKDVETFYNENRDSEHIDILKELDFVDRIYLCQKFSASEEEFEAIMFFDEHKNVITLSGYELNIKCDNNITPFDYYYDILGTDEETYENFSYYNDTPDFEMGEVYSRFFDILNTNNKNAIRYYFKKISEDFNIPLLKSNTQKILDNFNKKRFYDFDEEAMDYITEVSNLFQKIIEEIEEVIIDNTVEKSQEDYNTFHNSIKGEYDSYNEIWKIDLEEFYDLISTNGIISGSFKDIVEQKINDISDNTYNTVGYYPYQVYSYDISQEYVEKCNKDILEIFKEYEQSDDEYNHYKLIKIENLIRNGFKYIENEENRFTINPFLYKKNLDVIYFLDDRTIDEGYEQKINIKIHKGSLKEILDNPNDDYKSYEMKLIANKKDKIEFKDPNQLKFQFEHLKTFKGFKLM